MNNFNSKFQSYLLDRSYLLYVQIDKKWMYSLTKRAHSIYLFIFGSNMFIFEIKFENYMSK